MSLLTVENLSHSFIDKELYKDTGFTLNKEDHMGVTGQNGVGKSTLINILINKIDADEGKITWQKNVDVGYLDQYAKLTPGMSIKEFLMTAFDKLFAEEKRMQQLYEDYAVSFSDKDLEKAGRIQTDLEEQGFYDLETRVEQVATGLGLDVLGYDHNVSELSGGQRSKIILSKLLLQNPDVLVLDEPTNYLDVNHIAWLSDYLNNFEGAYLVVSHDYDFLEKITNCIIDVEFGKITKYKGQLGQALKQKEANKESYLRAFENQQAKILKTEAYIRKFKAGTRSKSAQSRVKQLNRMDKMDPPKINKTSNFEFPYLPTVSRILLQAQDLVIGYDGHALVSEAFNFSVGNDEKVAITGFNGIGKSTLLKTVLGQIPAIYGGYDLNQTAKLGYFKQDLNWENGNATPFQFMQQNFEDKKQKELRTVLARAGLNAQQVMSPLKSLSGGEQMKVKLAKLMMEPSNLLFLDEPTNHLDVVTKDALRKAIIEYPGGVVVVSHEKDFFEGDWVDKVIDIEKMNK